MDWGTAFATRGIRREQEEQLRLQNQRDKMGIEVATEARGREDEWFKGVSDIQRRYSIPTSPSNELPEYERGIGIEGAGAQAGPNWTGIMQNPQAVDEVAQ